jgi:hypothetical protein
MTTVPQPAGPGEPSRWQTVVKTARVFWKDFRERAWSTFWQAFVAVLALAHPTTDWSELGKILAAAVAAGIAALLSMAKSIVVRNRGVKNSASSSKNV